MQRSPEWKVKGVKHGKKHKKTDSEISRIGFLFVTLFYYMYYICMQHLSTKLYIVIGLHYLLIRQAYNSDFLSKFADMK